MSKQRYIQDKFWTDSYVQLLNTEEKLVFLYLLTNPLVSICGIYEITPERIKFETGCRAPIDILSRLARDGKIIYYKNFLYLVNFLKNQNVKSEDLKKGIERELSQIPDAIKSYFRECLQTLPRPSLDPPKKCVELSKVELSKVELSKVIYNNTKFDRFWKCYPKKKAKADALRAFTRTDVDIEIILKAINAQLKSSEWRKDNGRYIPYPATWLNSRRWEDELTPPHKIPII